LLNPPEPLLLPLLLLLELPNAEAPAFFALEIKSISIQL
jgi:hypothetical protein